MEQTKDERMEDVSANSPALTTTSNEHHAVVKHEDVLPPQVIGSAINHLNLLNEKDVVAAEAFLTRIMRSEKGGIKSVQDGLAILMRCQDLAIPFSTALEHIHVINGKTGIDVHVAKALLTKAGCTWRTIKDYQPQYECTDGINVYCDTQLPEYCVRCISKQEAESRRNEDKDGDKVYVYPVKFYSDFNGNKYKDYQLNSKLHKVVSTKAEAVALAQQKIVGVYRIPAIPIDYVHEYEFTRTIKGKEVTAISHFSFTEAQTAGFFEKDTYLKYARIMIAHRAFFFGARDIANDVLLGASDVNELRMVNNMAPIYQDVTYEDI